jgi:hypothetical protein
MTSQKKYKQLEKIMDQEVQEYISELSNFWWYYDDDYNDWDELEGKHIYYEYEELETEPSDKYVLRKYRGLHLDLRELNTNLNIKKVDMMSFYPIEVLREKKLEIIFSED